MIELHEYGSHEVHKALKLARYLEEAGPESREERAIVELAIELQKAVSRSGCVHMRVESESWAQALEAFTKARCRETSTAAREVLEGLPRFSSGESNAQDGLTCQSCGYQYTLSLKPGDEPTAFCDSCAHEAVDTLANELSVMHELWCNVRTHVDEYPAHIELKARAAQLEGERDALAAELDALGEREATLSRQLQGALNTLENAVHENEDMRAELADQCRISCEAQAERDRLRQTVGDARRRPPAVHSGEGYRVTVELDPQPTSAVLVQMHETFDPETVLELETMVDAYINRGAKYSQREFNRVLERLRERCDHEGIGKPGCTTCDPRTGPRVGASRREQE